MWNTNIARRGVAPGKHCRPTSGEPPTSTNVRGDRLPRDDGTAKIRHSCDRCIDGGNKLWSLVFPRPTASSGTSGVSARLLAWPRQSAFQEQFSMDSCATRVAIAIISGPGVDCRDFIVSEGRGQTERIERKRRPPRPDLAMARGLPSGPVRDSGFAKCARCFRWSKHNCRAGAYGGTPRRPGPSSLSSIFAELRELIVIAKCPRRETPTISPAKENCDWPRCIVPDVFARPREFSKTSRHRWSHSQQTRVGHIGHKVPIVDPAVVQKNR